MSLIHGMYHAPAKFPLLHCFGSGGQVGKGQRQNAPRHGLAWSGNGDGIGYGYAVGTSGFAIGQGDDNGAGEGNGNGSGDGRDGLNTVSTVNTANYIGTARLGHPFYCSLIPNSSGRYWLGRSTTSPDLIAVNPIGVFLLREGFYTYPAGLI